MVAEAVELSHCITPKQVDEVRQSSSSFNQLFLSSLLLVVLARSSMVAPVVRVMVS